MALTARMRKNRSIITCYGRCGQLFSPGSQAWEDCVAPCSIERKKKGRKKMGLTARMRRNRAKKKALTGHDYAETGVMYRSASHVIQRTNHMSALERQVAEGRRLQPRTRYVWEDVSVPQVPPPPASTGARGRRRGRRARFRRASSKKRSEASCDTHCSAVHGKDSSGFGYHNCMMHCMGVI